MQKEASHNSTGAVAIVREVLTATPEMHSRGLSCNEMCGSGGGWVSGTAPFCAGSCDDCGQGERCAGHVDSGASCWSGYKVCCCYGSDGGEVMEAVLAPTAAPHSLVTYEEDVASMQKEASHNSTGAVAI